MITSELKANYLQGLLTLFKLSNNGLQNKQHHYKFSRLYFNAALSFAYYGCLIAVVLGIKISVNYHYPTAFGVLIVEICFVASLILSIIPLIIYAGRVFKQAIKDGEVIND